MLKRFLPLAINSPVGSRASSSPTSTCTGAAPPSPIPPENVVTCQLLTCGQINFLPKGVSRSLLVPVYRQKCRYRYGRYQYPGGRPPPTTCGFPSPTTCGRFPLPTTSVLSLAHHSACPTLLCPRHRLIWCPPSTRKVL